MAEAAAANLEAIAQLESQLYDAVRAIGCDITDVDKRPRLPEYWRNSDVSGRPSDGDGQRHSLIPNDRTKSSPRPMTQVPG